MRCIYHHNETIVLTLGLLDDPLELFASMTELADSHTGPVVVEEALGGLLQHARGQRRRPCGHVVDFSTIQGHGGSVLRSNCRGCLWALSARRCYNRYLNFCSRVQGRWFKGITESRGGSDIDIDRFHRIRNFVTFRNSLARYAYGTAVWVVLQFYSNLQGPLRGVSVWSISRAPPMCLLP